MTPGTFSISRPLYVFPFDKYTSVNVLLTDLEAINHRGVSQQSDSMVRMEETFFTGLLIY